MKFNKGFNLVGREYITHTESGGLNTVFIIDLLFGRKQQQIFITYRSQYHFRNQRTRLTYISVENMSLRLFGNFNTFCLLIFI